MASISTKRKISKLTDDIAALEKTIKENTRKLAELKEEKTETENTEIISIIRKAGLSIEDIEELIDGGITQVQAVPKPPEENTRSVTSELKNERKIPNET